MHVLELFLKHPREMGETYVQHGWQALRVAAVLAAGAVAAFVHAFFPRVCTHTASSCAQYVVTQTKARQHPVRCLSPNPADQTAFA